MNRNLDLQLHDGGLDPYFHALESIGEGANIITPDNQTRYVNGACATMYGYAKDELIGQPVTIFIPPGEVLIDDEAILSTPDEKWEGDVVRLKKGGEKIFVHLTMTLITNNNEEVVGLVVIHRDTTERKRAEDDARRLSRENQVMAEIGRIISSSLDIDRVYQQFAKQVSRLIPFDRLSISTTDERQGVGIVTYVSGIAVEGRGPGDVFPITSSLGGEATRTRSSVILRGPSREELIDHFSMLLPNYDAGIRSFLAVPL